MPVTLARASSKLRMDRCHLTFFRRRLKQPNAKADRHAASVARGRCGL